MYPRETLQAFDRLIAQRGLRLDAIVVGGAALNLLGVISRETKDCDILHPSLGDAMQKAAREFAMGIRASGGVLVDEWLNNGPSALIGDLPPGWQGRVQMVFRGEAIELHTLGRSDLLKAKVFALCDRGFDLPDCVAMNPTADELADLLPWLEVRDLHPGWPDHVRATVSDLARRLGHGL